MLRFQTNLFIVVIFSFFQTVCGLSTDTLFRQTPIFYENEDVFRSLLTTRYNPSRNSMNVIDAIELFMLSSSSPEIESYLLPGSGQHRYAIDVSAINGGFFVSSAANEVLRSSQSLLTGKGDENGELMVLSRVKIQPPTIMAYNLLTFSTLDHLSSVNGSMTFYRPLLSISVGTDRLMVEYISGYGSSYEPIRIPIPFRLADDKWHSLVVHWTKNGGDDDDFYVWVDCQLVYQGIALLPELFTSNDWSISVGSPPLPTFVYIDEPPQFSRRKRFFGLIEQLVISRDRLFWQFDDQCRYQRETSAVKNSCPICTSSTLFTNNAIKKARSKLMNDIGRNKQKIVEEFDTIKEQLGAALRRIEFLEHIQKMDEEKSDNSGRCYEREVGRFFNISETWSINNCTKHCTCNLVNGKPRAVCRPLRCSPHDVADCPTFPYGSVVWDVANGCCPRCKRVIDSSAEVVRTQGRSCVRWNRASMVPHGAFFFIKLANNTCAEKRCIDGREIYIRQGPSQLFCGNQCLKTSISTSQIQDQKLDTRLKSRQVCCGYTSGFCKIRSCELNATSTCDVPERASCIDTPEDIICQCRSGYIGDGSHCIDIDECNEHHNSRFSANCADSEVCINTPGGYHCVAKAVSMPDATRTSVTVPSIQQTWAAQRRLSQNFPTDPYKHGVSTCDEASEILVRFSPAIAMCHCLPGFVRVRPTILLAFSQDTLPSILTFSRNASTVIRKKCFDVDECNQMGSNACSEKHQCTNIPGSYVCISSSYTSHEAHEIKFTANARRSTENAAGGLRYQSFDVFSIFTLSAALRLPYCRIYM